MRIRVAIVLAALGTPMFAATAAAGAGTGCRRGDPLANVGSPARLKVMDRCRTVINVMGDLNVSCLLDGREPAPADPEITSEKRLQSVIT